MTAMTASVVRGTAGDDNLTGSGNADDFALWQGGSDTVDGGGGNDIFRMGAALDAGDKLDGGTGKDAILLNGDYSAGLVLNADTITNIEVMQFAAGHSYNLTTNDGNVAAGGMLLVKGGSLGAGNTLTFDGSAELDGRFTIIGGAGNDTLTGGAKHDVFYLSSGGNDTAHGGGGNDIFIMGGALTSGDVVDGGAGRDTLELNGDYSGFGYTFGAGQLTGIETLKLDGADRYNLTWNDTDLASGQTLTVDFHTATGDAITFNGGAEQDGNFHFIAGAVGGAGLTGGTGNDMFDMTGIRNFASGQILGNGGDDTVLYGANLNTLLSTNIIDGGDGNDTFEINGDYSALTLQGADVMNFETFRFDGGHSYGNVNIAEVTSPALVTVDASQVSTLFHLFFEGTAFTVEVGSGGMVGGPGDAETFNDTFIVTSEGALAASTLNGGNGTDTLVLNGDFSGGFTLGATITNFENITLEDGNSYSFGTVDAIVAAGATMTIDASALTGSNALFFSGGSETDGHFAFISGAGADSISGGKLSDTFDLSRSNGAFVSGFDGNDTFTVTTAASLLSDSIDGGSGSDTLMLNGDFSGAVTTLTGSNLTSIENLTLAGAANSYNIAVSGSISGSTALTVDASGAAQLTADFSAMTVAVHVTGSAGDDTITFGSNFSTTDTINGGAGSDTLALNGTYPSSPGWYTFGAGQFASVETLSLLGGNNYNYSLITDDNNVAAGHTLTVDLGIGNVDFDGSAETDGNFHFIVDSTSHLQNVKGGGGNDVFDMTGATGYANVSGGGGDDTYLFGGNFDRLYFTIQDSGGDDTVEFNGDYSSLSLDSSIVTGVDTFRFDGGHTYQNIFLTDDGTASLTVDASQVTTLFQVTAGDGGFFIFEVGSGGMDAKCLVPNNDDTFIVTSESALAASTLDAGSGGTDTLELNGDFSTTMTIGAPTIANFENITVEDGHSYSFATLNSVVAAGATLTIDASALTGSNTLSFGGHAETDSHFAFIGGAGPDFIEGGQQSDTFDLSLSDGAFAFGDGGDDSFTVTTRAHLLSDIIDGGNGSDTLILNGDFSTLTSMTSSSLMNTEVLQLLGAANSYNLTVGDGITAALTVDASAANQLTFSGAGDTTTAFTITGTAHADTITGGGQADIITGGLGADALTGGGGTDLFIYAGATDSNTTALDSISDFTAGTDKFELNTSMFWNGEVSTSVSLGSLDADLASAFTTAGAGATSGYVFDFTGGELNGRSFLVVDSNGNGAYNAGTDLVIEITGHTGTFTSGDFI